MERTRQIDRLTVIAIAVIAYAAANITHEIIGHCGIALVMGTPCTVVSSFYNPLEIFPPTWKYNIIVVAGSTANFAVGLICLAALRRGRRQEADGSRQEAEGSRQEAEGSRQTAEFSSEKPRQNAVKPAHCKDPGGSGRWLLMLWLLMAVNLFLPSTYIAAAPIIKFGDSYILIQDLSGQIFWRPMVALAGATALWFSFRVCRFELARLIGAKGIEARAIAWQFVVPAYLAGGILWVASALFSRLDWRIAQLEAAGGTFGLTIWLLLLPLFLPQLETEEREPLSLPRSPGWIIAGALTALFFIGVWGKGIDL
jgi:hypothetical protein